MGADLKPELVPAGVRLARSRDDGLISRPALVSKMSEREDVGHAERHGPLPSAPWFWGFLFYCAPTMDGIADVVTRRVA